MNAIALPRVADAIPSFAIPLFPEPIMKPLTLARRSARWLMAAGLAVAALAQGTPAHAAGDLRLEMPERIERGPDELRPFFTKTGRQRGCGYVEYKLRFGLKGSPAAFAAAPLEAMLSSMRMDFSDQMPNGLTVIDVDVSGDGKAGGGGALPAGTIGTTADPNDTAEIKDFRLTIDDVDGSGEPDERVVNIRIVAKIDPLAFPAPTAIDNQGWVNVSRPGGAMIHLPSHNPALPDDGDFMTGEKTTITVDLTGCEPPPPPPGGEAPCFEVVVGEVDCVPGGGAFTYHMPVGPDLAGKWVQVRTTTPGVTVGPGPQLVPAGGGVLDWTITGAAPGDTVTLIVTGIETYAGPAEGVGLCCSQTVEIEIPADLDCPDEKKEPDLQVAKKGDVAFCTKEGGCDYTVTVTNVGDGAYNGKIVLEDVTGPASATVSSGPNAPWTCLPGASPLMCEHPATTLDPGESVELKLGFTPGPDWDWRAIRNCAEYDYTASGKESFGDLSNDRACATIPICIPGRDRACTPPEQQRPDIAVVKRPAPSECTADGLCRYTIFVGNAGAVPFNGPLTVIDEFPTHPPVSVNFEPTGPWTCTPESTSRFRCEHPGLVLPPGATTIISVEAVATGYPTREVENCAEVPALPGETNLDNNKSCAVATLPGPNDRQPPLKVEKTGDKQCVAGQPCTFEITVSNDGNAPFSGQVRIGDAVGLEGLGRLEGVPITEVSPPFGCAEEPTTLPMSCVANVTLGAGESRVHQVTIVIPETSFEGEGPIQGRNCVGVLRPGTPVIGTDRNEVRGGAVDGGPDNRGYACHEFELVKQKQEPQCSAGLVPNADGRCVCPAGTNFRNGKCAGGNATQPDPGPKEPTPPVKPPVVKQCTLLKGQIRTKSGECVCPRGTELKNGACRKVVAEEPPPVRQCTLLKGQIRTKSGECVCPRGTRLVGNACQKQTVVCKRGQTLVNGKCVTVPKPLVCRKGQVERNGKCVNVVLPQRCPKGTTGTPPNCRKQEIKIPNLRVIPEVLKVLPRRDGGNTNGNTIKRDPTRQ